MDILSSDGSLSMNDFSVATHAFAEKWRRLNSTLPPWLWVKSQKWPLVASQEVEGYLSLENICLVGSCEDNNEELRHIGDQTSCSDSEDAIDDAILVQSSEQEAHHYDFHIVYSASYRVPVLYFRAYSSDGRPLLLNEIEKDLPACSTTVLLESKWTFITQEEHPYLNRPWFKLHPCGTSEWMKLLFLGDAAFVRSGMPIERYLVSWLSVVGQVVGIRIPIEMVNDQCNS